LKAAPAVDAAAFKADLDRLQELNKMFGNASVLRDQPERAIEQLKQLEPAKQERQRIKQKYESLLQQKTPQARQMQTMVRGSDDVFERFEAEAARFVEEAPGRVETTIGEALALAKQGVEEQKPAFFGAEGGVPQRLRWAEQRLAALQAAAPDAAPTKQAEDKLKAARARAQEMAQSLRGAILDANRVPDERYAGPDAAALREVVKQKWAKDGNGAEVLKVGLNGKDWKRDTRWEWSRGNKAFEKVDTSRVQGFVVVKHPGDLAAVHYVNLVKDHMAGDAVQAYFVGSVKGEPAVEDLVLMKNVK
jgi:hypothetical protein